MFFVSDTLRQYPEIAIFFTLALGFWFGSLKFRSFSLGAVTSTLLAGLVVGQLHIPIPPVVQSTFFLMFLFAVGYGVGPQFFRALKKDGLSQVATGSHEQPYTGHRIHHSLCRQPDRTRDLRRDHCPVDEVSRMDMTLREAALKLGFLTAEQFDSWVCPQDMTHPLAKA